MRFRPAAAALAIAAGVFGIGAYHQTAAQPAAVNTYVDPARCAQCHAGIAKTFARTGMGRSFSRVGSLTPGATFYHAASDSYFATVERGGRYYQRRWQIGFDGKETNVDEKTVDFVMGSGNHAQTFLHLTPRNTLQQLPLGWYAEKGGYWAMNPGYDVAEHRGSTRVIHYECMFCHNAYPLVPAGHLEAGAEAQYLQPIPEGIDCQRCHGPGSRHVQTAGRAGAKPEEIRAAIVNPTRLSPERDMEVCMQCHLETTSRLLPHSLQRRDRGAFSYVPGEPLADFRLSFDRRSGSNQDFEIAHHAYRLRESQCFLKSAGKLRCTTCHNPHDIPHSEAAVSHYDAACRTCHTPAASHPAADRCASCHMPERRTDDAVHVVMTDHKIVRRAPLGDLLAERQEKHESPATSYRGEVVPYYPEKPGTTPEAQLDIALAQVIDRSNLDAGLQRLSTLIERFRPADARYYSGLGEAWRAKGDLAKAAAAFEEAARRAQSSETVTLQVGNAYLESRQWAKAEAAFRRAKTLRPDDAVASGMLGWALWQQDKTAEAKSSIETGLKLDPDSPELHNYLASLLIGTGDATGAEREFRAAVRINPGIAEWRLSLATILAARGAMAEAAFEAKASATLDPTLAAAHELWGRLLSAAGDLAGAERELQSALRLKPDSWRAHYELGVVLGQRGNRAGAIEHFREAVKGSDPQAQAAALEMLRRLGQ